MTLKELQKRRADLVQRSDSTLNTMQALADESARVAEVAHNSKKVIDNLDNEFESQTGLRGKDIAFMFFATALQCIRQYLLTDFKERVDDQTAAKNTKGHSPEHSDRIHRWYNPSLNEIITNPVPFDAMSGSSDFDLGLSGITHRTKALGHDPLLGWIFGTANIATSTITTWNMASYHVKTGSDSLGRERDWITNNAQTDLVLSYTKDKLFHNGMEGKKIFIASLGKELVHLKSDLNTKKSLPLPLVSVISPQLADNLISYGVDMANILTVAKQMAYATLINALIGMLHYLSFEPAIDGSKKLYEVRTHKVITYSNLIATGSNILYVAINSVLGNQVALRKLDVGGFIITLYRLINNQQFIQKIKEEFVFDSFNKMIQGE